MTTTEEVPIGPNSCHYCGGEYGDHQEWCKNRRVEHQDQKTVSPTQAIDMLQELNTDLTAVRKVLYKYQARYHGASVMDQRDWDEGQRCLVMLDKWISK